MAFLFEQEGFKKMKPCEETNPYAGYTNPEFIAAQAKQRKCLDNPTGFNWNIVDVSGIDRGLGLVTNPWPQSFLFAPVECANGVQLPKDIIFAEVEIC